MTIPSRAAEDFTPPLSAAIAGDANNGLRSQYIALLDAQPGDSSDQALIAGAEPDQPERGPLDKLCRSITFVKEPSLAKREEAVAAAFEKAKASGKKEDQDALAKTLLENFGNIRIPGDSKASELLKFCAAGHAGDLPAYAAAKLCIENGTNVNQNVWGYAALARLGTKASDEAVHKEAKGELAKVQATMRKIVLNGPDPDEPGLPEAVVKRIKELKPEEIEEIKEYYRALLRMMDKAIADAKKEK